MKRVRNFGSYLETIGTGKLLVLGYLSYVVVGWMFLQLEFAQNRPIPTLDSLFTAASAVSTTGLVVASTGKDYSFFGQLVILILIQAGGLGYMTFSSFVLLSSTAKLSQVRKNVTLGSFPIPKSFKVPEFIRSIVIFTVLAEVIGAIALYFLFRAQGVPNPIWAGVFHSVSAFCTAGFSLFDDSMTRFSGSVPVNLVIAALSYGGALGFIVWLDIWRVISQKQKYLTFTSKLILSVSFWFLVLGTAYLYLSESSLQELPPHLRFITAMFQAMSASTTVGFNSIDIGQMAAASLLFVIVLMVFGASPSGTGGGLKSTTVSVLAGLLKSTLKRRDSVRFRKRELSTSAVQTASASFAFYIGVLCISAILLLMLEPQLGFKDAFFELASAIGTVGLSTGITGSLQPMSKFLVVCLMVMGRVGILTFAISVSPDDETRAEEQDSDVVL